MAGLKPSDYFLYKSMCQFFEFDLRDLVVLGLRYLYASAHDSSKKEQILQLAQRLKEEDLDIEPQDRPIYTDFTELMHRQTD